MKQIRTALSWQAVDVDQDTDKPRTITSTPLEVSNADADRFVALAAEAGVQLEVSDVDDVDPDGLTVVGTPDLSNGVGAVTGQGDPVTTPGDQPATESAAGGKNKEK